MKQISCALYCAFCCSFAFAQSDVQRNHIAIGGGPAIPVGNTTNYLATAPLFTLGYGYRFNHYFQADIGFQMAFGAAHNQNGEVTDYGTVQGGDHEYMIPLGGRFIIPSHYKRMEFSVGTGAAYLHYAETAPSNPDFPTNCYSCVSRGGWGGYGLGNASWFLDDSHNFHLGTTFQYIVGRTNGPPVGNVPGLPTTDRWANMSIEFGLSF